MLLTDGSDGGMCALLRSRRRLCEFRHGSLCTCLHTLATRASGGRALLSTESCYPCIFALFYPRPPPALASVSFAAQSAHCSPASRTPRRPTAPRPPNRPALLAFPPPLPTERTCEQKAKHAGTPTAKSLFEWCEQEPWPPPSCRHPLSPHPRPLAVTSHLTSSPPPTIHQSVVKHSFFGLVGQIFC